MQGRALDPNSPLPRYYQIYNALLSMIEGGRLCAGQALPPERHIADVFGVARPTVVKALDLLEHEGRIAKHQGKGNIVLELPKTQEAKTIAFVSSPHMTDDLLMGISQKAFESNYNLQILGVDYQFAHLQTYLDACLSKGVQGFLVYGRSNHSDAKIYQELLAKDVPIVMVDRYYPELNCDHVVYDNEAASFELTRQLLARGHQTLAVVPGQEINSSSVKDRLKGYKRALEHSGIRYDEELVWLDLYESFMPIQHVQVGYTEALEKKLEYFKPTAILTINDLIANYLVHDLMLMQDCFMRSALEGMVDSSNDYLSIELASFGTKAISNYNFLKVFAVHPTFELGRAATSLLIDRLSGSLTTDIKHLTMPMQIVECPDQAKELALGKGG